jgi:Trypsin-like peptidase domain/Effector-associated domain 1
VFPPRDLLRQFSREGLDWSIDALAPGQGDSRSTVLLLIETAEREGLLDVLVARAREAAPGSRQLALVAEELGVSTLIPGDPAVIDSAASHSALDADTWRERLGEIEHQVCQVEHGDNLLGTAFLVGADLVLTAGHVLGLTEHAKVSEPELRVRFDHTTGRSNRTVTPGTAFPLDSVVARSERLDYAFLRVQGSPGVQPIVGGWAGPGGTLRRWIDVTDPPPIRPGSGLVMVKHTRERSLSLALGSRAVSTMSPDGTRVTYKLESEPSSSGAPCFTYELDLVALNVAIDPDGPRKTSVGVLASAVIRDLRQQGFGHLLGTAFA